MRFRRPALVLLGMAALLALAFALSAEPIKQTARYVLDHPLGLLAACTAYTAAFVLRALSWRQLLPERVPLAGLFSLVAGALFLNHLAPAKAGDLARMYALSRRWDVAGERAVASVLLSRLVDLAGLVAVLCAAWALAGAGLAGVGGWERLAYPAAFLAAVAAALLVLARARLTVRLAPRRLAAVGRLWGRLRGALRQSTRRDLSRALAFAAPAWVLEAGILLYVAKGMGLGLSFAEVVAATCFAVLVAAVPLAPGSLGTYEAGMVAALVAFGVAAEPAFAAAVVSHALKFLYALAAAPCGLAAVRKGGVADEAGVRV